MAQLKDIRSIILSMKAQSKGQTQAEAPQTEGSAALAVEPPTLKVAEPMTLIHGGKKDIELKENQHSQGNYPNEPNAQENSDNDTRHYLYNSKIKEAIKTLVLGVDYGPVKGIKGNMLFKKGALKLLHICGYKHHDSLIDKTVDAANGFIGYSVKVTITDDGETIAEAFGSANSKESKFEAKSFSADSMLIAMAEKRALIQAVKELIV